MESTSRLLMRANRTARNFMMDRSGVGAVEFAFIAPLMLVMFFGTIEFSQGVGANRKVTIMARTLSDLTSQKPRSRRPNSTIFLLRRPRS